MSKKTFTTEQIIVKLREIEVLCGQGKTIAEAVRLRGIRADVLPLAEDLWRHECRGGQRLKELEKENARIKKLVAELSLDNAIPGSTCCPLFLWLFGLGELFCGHDFHQLLFAPSSSWTMRRLSNGSMTTSPF
jgi:hypothetical protein